MSFWTLIISGLRYHWRTHLGVLLGAMIGAAVLTGALLTGDSVKASLKSIALSRLGGTRLAMTGVERFFRADLARELGAELKADAAAALQFSGVADVAGGGHPVMGVSVYGVDESFWKLGGVADPLGAEAKDVVALSERLAQRLGVKLGDEIMIRLPSARGVPLDAPLAAGGDMTEVLSRLKVHAIAGDDAFGRFGLQANQTAPLNAFLPAKWLENRMELPGRANLLLIGARLGAADKAAADVQVEEAQAAMQRTWRAADADINIRMTRVEAENGQMIEIRSGRIFLDEAVIRWAMGDLAAAPGGAGRSATGVMTYLANELASAGKAAPYSMVAAIGGGATATAAIVKDLKPGGVIINRWLAEDLGISAGGILRMTYYVVDEQHRLVERQKDFEVAGVVEMKGAAADTDLMPEFPGISDSTEFRNWKPGVPIDLKKVRKQDDDYWKERKGTPKAFIGLADGKAIWGSRFGDLTSLRFPVGPEGADASIRRLEDSMLKAVNPRDLGLFFQPVRNQALAGSEQSLDFGQLFLGFSFFLIIAALVLTGLLFVLGIQQRGREMGTLLAVGYPPATVRRLMMAEGAALATVGGLCGAGLGVLYTRALLTGLGTIWSGAVGVTKLQFSAGAGSIAIGAFSGILCAVIAMIWASRRMARQPARVLLAGEVEESAPVVPGTPGTPGSSVGMKATRSVLIGWAMVAGAGAMVWMGMGQGMNPGLFFGAGGLLLIGLLLLGRGMLVKFAGGGAGGAGLQTLSGLAMRNGGRRLGRSMATVSMLACGSFLVVAVGANRHDASQDADKPSSGTGGYRLYAQSTLPVVDRLDDPKAWEKLGLDETVMQGVGVLGMRMRDGDDASCLNLNRAQKPRLLGVDGQVLAARGAFTFKQVGEGIAAARPWEGLSAALPEGEVAAVGDEATVFWALGLKVGQALEYSDERGRPVKLRIVGMMANSVLQGALVIDIKAFERLFPSESGRRVFLFDLPKERLKPLMDELARGMEDAGLTLTPAHERLAAFNEVEHTYLSIFQALGGLGMLLGCAGLGMVVLRNVMERRGELGLLRAVGFGRGAMVKLVLWEHWMLAGLGLGIGVIAAGLAVLPAALSPGAGVPWVSLGLTLAAIAASALAWTLGATLAAVRGGLAENLRAE